MRTGQKTSLKSLYRKPAPLAHQTLVLYLKIKAIKTFKIIYKNVFEVLVQNSVKNGFRRLTGLPTTAAATAARGCK